MGRLRGGDYYSMPELSMPSTRNEVSYHSPAVPTEVVGPLPLRHRSGLPCWWSSMGPYGPTIVHPADKIGAHDSKNLKFLAKLFVFRGKI